MTEVSQTQDRCCRVPVMGGPQESDSDTQAEWWVPVAGELVCDGDHVSVWEAEEVLEMDGGGGCTRV